MTQSTNSTDPNDTPGLSSGPQMHADALRKARQTPRQYDVILYGATGFTGRQTAQYFAQYASQSLPSAGSIHDATQSIPSVRWAIAGRSREKLEQVKQSLGAAGSAIDIIVADCHDVEKIDAMVKSTRVMLSTAGPFSLYGEAIVRACAREGVDYVDITGETPFVRRMLDLYESDAIRSGAKIIHFCGFDSIPSDLGAFLAVEHLKVQHRLSTHRVKAFFEFKGDFNGGTLASGLAMNDPAVLSQLNDPVLLSTPDYQTDLERKHNPDVKDARFDADLNGWAIPFFMAPVNTRVVRRSRALLAAAEQDYGPHFQYQEFMRLPKGGKWVAALVARAMGAVDVIFGSRIGRWYLKTFGPKPGEGPSEAVMNGGFFKTTLFADAEASGGAPPKRVKVVLKDKGDPGNRATVKMLCECALALAIQRDELPGGAARAGFLTPASAFGHVLVERLKARGMRITVEDYDTPWKNVG